MTLNIPTHRTALFQILKDLYSDAGIAPFLGFKGGSAALLYYKLDRFSVDLDFDLLNKTEEDYVYSHVTEKLSKDWVIKESGNKRFNLFWLLSYDDRYHNIKIEINKRDFGSKYEVKTYLGVSMLVMVSGDMFAHKLVAMKERFTRTNRDLYDVWFFLKNRFPINKEIVEKRSEQTFDSMVMECIKQLETKSNRGILTGIGELLDPKQKEWVKNNLISETIALLKLRLDQPRI